MSDFSRSFSAFGKLISCLFRTNPSIFLVFVCDGQLEPAFCSSSLQYQASAFRTHAGTEAELPISLGLAGLVGALHGILLLIL